VNVLPLHHLVPAGLARGYNKGRVPLTFGDSPHLSFRRDCAGAEGEKGCCKEGRIRTGGSHIRCPHATTVKISAVARAPFLPPGVRRILPSSQQSAATRTRRRRPANLNATCTLQTQTTSTQLCKTRSNHTYAGFLFFESWTLDHQGHPS
jgi:hypothetical protein